VMSPTLPEAKKKLFLQTNLSYWLMFVQGLEGPENKMQNISLRLSQVTFLGVLWITLHAFSDVVPLQKLTAVAVPTLLQWPVHIKIHWGSFKWPTGPCRWSALTYWTSVIQPTVLTRGRSPPWYKHACSTVMEHPLVSVKGCYAESHDIAYQPTVKSIKTFQYGSY
jgi:hypothetical protein